MRDCKMCEVQISVESEHIQKHIKQRVCVPQMYLSTIVRLTVSVLVAMVAYLFLAPLAYAERGYHAIGGEWILVIVVFGFVYQALTNSFSREEEQ